MTENVMSRSRFEMHIKYIPVILECWTRRCTWVVALAFDVGECTGGHEWARLVMNVDGHGWGTDGGHGWTRVLALVIITLSGKKKTNKQLT